MDIKKLIRASEGKTLEFKRDTSALKPIMKTIIAFANTAGGVIIIGKEDNGEIIGVEDPLQVEEQLCSAIADSIAPMMMPDIEIMSVAGKSLLCIRVAHWPGPFYLKSEGDEQGVYIRLGSSTRQAGPEFIAEIKRTVPKFVLRNSRLASRIDSFVREDIHAYPDIALREVVINAIAHADYSLQGM